MRHHTIGARGVAFLLVALLLVASAGCLQARSAILPSPQPDTGGKAPGSDPAPKPDPGPATPPRPATKPGDTVTSPDKKPTGVWLDVDITTQRVRVMNGETVSREMIASTGTVEKPTPLGTFSIQNRGEWFFSQKYQQGGRWWVSFKDWGVYLFHSVPMDEQKSIIAAEAEKLGQRASHGCVRLSVEDAKWIYDNIKAGTRVVIHE